ncbi:unc-112-related protein [Trichonephila clavata]|uniref:Unc-112-related protein n=1 Tax=Trichonephila clavata TaxID=2740835 RepID=A0A8X6HAU3_TRICU|nr:unc-112-related protein [Trichonephila clavata]
MNEHLPVCVALQETLLKPSCTSNIRGYSILRKDCNTEKTFSVVFSQKRGVFPNPELFIGRSIIKVVKEFKFLGLIFDQSLRFHHHLKDLKIVSAKALNILKVANTRWGADRTSLLRLYRALIRSKLDYGSVVYSSACKSLLKILDPVHHQGLRLCLGAFCTSPVESLYAEAYEPPLDLRRKYLCFNHFMKIQSMKTNTAYSYLFNFSLYDFNSHRSFLIYSQPFHFRIRDLINDLNLNIGRIALCKISEVPPWKVIYPKVDFTLSCYSKACTPVSTYRTLYLEHRELFSDYEPIFMDGSKSESHVGSAVVSLSTVITDALPISASIYTAELHALRIAIEHISLSCGKKFIIYTDSLSSLQSIVSLHSSSHPILVDITYALANHLKKKDIRFCWIPGHAGITGNELADTAARSVTGSSERFPIPHSDLKACFRQKLQSVWQSTWDQQTENKLHSVMPVLAPTVPLSSNRREQVQVNLQANHPQPDIYHDDEDVDTALTDLQVTLEGTLISKGKSNITNVPELSDYLSFMKPKRFTLKGFKRYYIVLRDTYLNLYKSKDSEPNMSICLKGCEVTPDVNLSHGKYGIRLEVPNHEGMTEYWVRCSSEEQYAKWMAACRLAAKGKTMADSSYDLEVKSIQDFLNMQKPAPAAVISPSQIDINPDDMVAPRFVRKLKSQKVIQRILEAHANVKDLNLMEAKLSYIKAWQALPEFGMSLFVVRFDNSRKDELLGIAFNRLMRMDLSTGDHIKTWRYNTMKVWNVNWEVRQVRVQFEEENVAFSCLSADCKVVHEFIGGYIFLSMRSKDQNQTLNEELFHKLTGGWV